MAWSLQRPTHVTIRTMPGPKRIRRVSYTKRRSYRGQNRFEHWYVDNQVYFITAKCRDGFPAFTQEHAKLIF